MLLRKTFSSLIWWFALVKTDFLNFLVVYPLTVPDSKIVNTKAVKERISQIICALFILLFVYTGVSKLLSLEAFEKVLRQSLLLSRVSVFVSWGLPLFELLVACMLFFEGTRKWGLYISLFMMVLFTAYIGWMIAYEPKLPCSCGGVVKYLSWRQHLIFNTVFIALAITGIRTVPKGVS